MKKFFSIVCACLLALSAQATDIKKYDALYENLPFQMEKVTRPQFPANEVNLKDFGAIGDGSSLCTTAFAKAIDALTQKGGGKLIVPQAYVHRSYRFEEQYQPASRKRCSHPFLTR